MQVIPGIIASSYPAVTNSYESIATVTVGAGGSAGPLSFTSIPSIYKHLQIRWIGRGGSVSNNQSFGMRFNSDSGTNYTYHSLYGTGATAGATGATGYTYAYFDSGAGAGAGTNVFGAGIVDILDYTNINKNKTIRSLGGIDNNGSGSINLTSELWLSTSAITQIDIYPVTGNFTQYSTFALYGIK